MIPCTIKQLINAEQGAEANSFMIDGKRVHRVKVIAQIMEVSKQTNAITLVLDDGTGRIDTRYWLAPDADEDNVVQDTSEADAWQEGVYVRVFGNIRKFKTSEKHSFVAISVVPIQDFNEITFHLLEATFVHLKTLKDAQSGGGMIHMDVDHQQAIQNPYTAPAEETNDLQPLYAAVLEVVQVASANSTEGASISYICEQMSAYGIGEDQIRSAIQYLSSEGHLYPTFDEEHFKA